MSWWTLTSESYRTTEVKGGEWALDPWMLCDEANDLTSLSLSGTKQQQQSLCLRGLSEAQAQAKETSHLPGKHQEMAVTLTLSVVLSVSQLPLPELGHVSPKQRGWGPTGHPQQPPVLHFTPGHSPVWP